MDEDQLDTLPFPDGFIFDAEHMFQFDAVTHEMSINPEVYGVLWPDSSAEFPWWLRHADPSSRMANGEFFFVPRPDIHPVEWLSDGELPILHIYLWLGFDRGRYALMSEISSWLFPPGGSIGRSADLAFLMLNSGSTMAAKYFKVCVHPITLAVFCIIS